MVKRKVDWQIESTQAREQEIPDMLIYMDEWNL